jgi:hypothetical protein
VYFNSSLNGLDIHSAGRFKGVYLGDMKAVDIVYDADSALTTPVVAEIDAIIFSISARSPSKGEREQFSRHQIMNGLAAKLNMGRKSLC